ncbi:MAG: Smr/MutS family protein [Pseudomonadota bacterium]
MANDQDDDDDEVFRRSVGDVKPLPQSDRVEPYRPPIRPDARFRRADDADVLAQSLNPDREALEQLTGARLSHRRSDVSERTLKRLARGDYRIQGEIDLHGMTAVEAREALAEFISTARRDGISAVRVVHGKGLGSGPRGPVLKAAVNRALRRNAAVLAFVSARLVDGGTGALYVLLDTRL